MHLYHVPDMQGRQETIRSGQCSAPLAHFVFCASEDIIGLAHSVGRCCVRGKAHTQQPADSHCHDRLGFGKLLAGSFVAAAGVDGAKTFCM